MQPNLTQPILPSHNLNVDGGIIDPVTDPHKFQKPEPKKKIGIDWSPTKWEGYFDRLEFLEDVIIYAFLFILEFLGY